MKYKDWQKASRKMHSHFGAVEHYAKKGAISGAVVGGALGGASGASGTLPEKYDNKPTHQRAGKRFVKGLKGALGGALLGGYVGANAGARYGGAGAHKQDEQVSKAFNQRLQARLSVNSPHNLTTHLENLGVSTNLKSKKDLEKAYKQMSLKTHPDTGGSEEQFTKMKDSYDNLKKSSWFKKLSASRLPAIIPKAKTKFKFRPAIIDKIKAYAHVEPEVRKHYGRVAGVGGAFGGVTGAVSEAGKKYQLNEAYKKGKITKSEYETASKKTSVLKGALRGAAVGAGVGVGTTHALVRKAPVAAIMSGQLAGTAAGIYGGSAMSSPTHTRDKGQRKASEYLHKKNLGKGSAYD